MGRGSSKASGGNAKSNAIRDEFIQAGLQSRLKGVQRDAREGTGNYQYKDAKAVDKAEALTMKSIAVVEKGDKTLVHGLIGGEKVFYASESSDPTIKKLKQRQKDLSKGNLQKTDIKITPTSTYNSWKKKNDKNFEAWFNGSRKKRSK